MITAMCFISAIPDQISSARNAVTQVEGVCSVLGDGVNRFSCNHRSQRSLPGADVVADQIIKILGITSTETHIAFRTYVKRGLEAGFSIGN
jgi:hypothetical protein